MKAENIFNKTETFKENINITTIKLIFFQKRKSGILQNSVWLVNK